MVGNRFSVLDSRNAIKQVIGNSLRLPHSWFQEIVFIGFWEIPPVVRWAAFFHTSFGLKPQGLWGYTISCLMKFRQDFFALLIKYCILVHCLTNHKFYEMQKIDLGRDMFALVDDVDYPELSKYKWTAYKGKYTYYAGRREGGKPIFMHRQILGITDRNTLTDHENGNGLDNQRHNIRACTYSENNRNKRGYKNNVTKMKGVQKTSKGTWSARITHEKKLFYLGCFRNPEDAARAYDAAANRLHKGFAYLNKLE